MKRTTLFLLLLISDFSAQSQEPQQANKAWFKLGEGLNISLNNDDYRFNIGGFAQANYQYGKEASLKSTHAMSVPNTFLFFSGQAAKEKLSFLLQANFSLGNPLMDAWVAYSPVKALTVTFGQKQTFTNNREMGFREDRTAFNTRSILSTNLANTGREFGLFLESRFLMGTVGLAPKIAATSGDGRNSFGTNSSDPDKGGFKYGGRFDLYPLGFFTGKNDQIGADLARETSPKILAGVAWSYNRGASDQYGDGHGTFIMYDDKAREAYPDYRKLYADLLVKYNGFHLLGEYANATATQVEGLFTGTTAGTALEPGQISGFLNLGNAYNGEIGYVWKNGFAIDARYTEQVPEFDGAANNIYIRQRAWSAGLTKYFIDNRLKVQANFMQLHYPDKATDKNNYYANFFVQIVL